MEKINKIFIIIPIMLIQLYRLVVSPLLGANCRFTPTCSEYAKEAIEEHGLIKGTFLSMKRITKCHPIKLLGGSEGYDPVPREKK